MGAAPLAPRVDGRRRERIDADGRSGLAPGNLRRRRGVAARRQHATRAPLEDPGRPILVAAAFMLLGGVAPYLLVWIGTLMSIPALVWILWEGRASGAARAASLLVASCLFSPFVIESLSLPHSAVGFYLVAVFLLVAFGLYALLGDSRSPRGLVVRSLAASLGFALCCICRAGALLMAPAFGLALLVAVRRVYPRLLAGGLLRRSLLAALLTGLFVTPYLLVPPPH